LTWLSRPPSNISLVMIADVDKAYTAQAPGLMVELENWVVHVPPISAFGILVSLVSSRFMTDITAIPFPITSLTSITSASYITVSSESLILMSVPSSLRVTPTPNALATYC